MTISIHNDMRTGTIYIATVILIAGDITPHTLAMSDLPVEDSIFKKKGTSKDTMVRRTSKDPTNIPISSRRFRPAFTETNTEYEINCLYWNGNIVLKFSPYQGEARITVHTPERERVYRASTRGDITIVAETLGDYRVEVSTTLGSECTFEFTVTQ